MTHAGETYEEVKRRKLEENRRKVDKFKQEASAAANLLPTNSLGESYAEARSKKVEESRKLLVRIRHLSAAPSGSASPKPSPAEEVASQDGSTERRPSPSFPEQTCKEGFRSPAYTWEMAEVVQQPRDVSDKVSYVSAREYAKEKAEEKKVELGTKHPSIVMIMCSSSASGGFWLGFPVDFVTHLPKKKSLLTLVDEDGKETGTTYLPHHKELRGGWRRFSNEHHLADGDALVFQLIKEKTLKVYMFRSEDYKPS